MRPALRRLLAVGGADAVARALGFITTVYLARTLQPDSFGLITIGLAVLGYLLLAASPGIQTVETRNVAAGETTTPARIADVLGLRVVIAAGLWPLCAAGATLVLGATPVRDVVVLYASALLPLALFLDWYFAGREEFGTLGAGRIAAALAVLAATLVLVRSGEDLRAAPAAFALGSAAGAGVFALAFVARYGRLRLSWNPRGWLDVLRRNLPVGMATLLGQSTMHLPPIIVGILLTPADTGMLGAAQRLIPAVLLADRVVHALLLPAMTRYWSASVADSRRLFGAAFRLLAVLAIPLAGLGAAFAPSVMRVVYGSGYADGAPVFAILLGYVVLTLLNTVSLSMVLAAGKDAAYARIMLLSSLTLMALLLALTLLYGVRGAAAGVVLGELVTFLLLGREVHSLLAQSPGGLLLRFLPATAVMGIVMITGGWFIPVGWTALAGVAAFWITAGVTGVFSRSELFFVREKLL